MALGAETFEFFILVGWHKIASDTAVAGHGHRTLLGDHAIAAKIAGELGGGDGGWLVHGGNIREMRKMCKLRRFVF